LGNQPVEVGVRWSLDVEVSSADVVDGLVVNHERAVGVLEGGVASEDGVVWLNNGSGDLRGWVDSKLKLGFLAVVDRETFHEEGSETGTGTTAEGMEDQETLETGALVGELSDSVEDEVNNLFSDGVVTTGVVVGGIFLARDQLFWVEQLSVGASSDLVNDSWLQVNKDATWDVLASTSLGEKGVERVVASANGLVGWHLAIRCNAVLEAVKLPASVTDLGSGLVRKRRRRRRRTKPDKFTRPEKENCL
jgi:hypothetical protein